MATISKELGNKLIDSLLADMGSPDWGNITIGLFTTLDGADVKKMSLLDKYSIEISEYFSPIANGKYGVKVLVEEEGVRFIKGDMTVEVPVTKSEVLAGIAGYKHSGQWTTIRKQLVVGLYKLSKLLEASSEEDEAEAKASWKVEKPIGVESMTSVEAAALIDDEGAPMEMGTQKVVPPKGPIEWNAASAEGSPVAPPSGGGEGVTEEVSGSGYAKMKPTPTKVKAPKKEPVKKGKGEEAIPTEPVLLRDATMLYQPVRGTSAGSVYHVAALGSQCRMAVRITKGKISVRVEGSLNQWTVVLQQAGIDVKNHTAGEQYASIHLQVVSEQIARRTFGALLMATGEMWDHEMPKFEKLYQKGSG